MTTECHPLGFFLPEGARLLMLGSFPPPKARWSMDFFYPNIQNDMWRVMGLLFYADKDHFLATPKAFDRDKAIRFCRERGIALGDTAREVIRQKANASDKFLEVIVPIDLEAVLSELPACEAIVVTGQKALETLLGVLASAEDPVVVEAPKVGSCASIACPPPRGPTPSLWPRRPPPMGRCSVRWGSFEARFLRASRNSHRPAKMTIAARESLSGVPF